LPGRIAGHLGRCAPDLASGRWAERNQQLMGLDEADLDDRVLIA
jgi:hypothetical protein